MEILVFEPVNQIATLIINAMIQAGFKVRAVSSHADIKTQLQTKKFNVLLVDCNPEDLKGTELIKELKASTEYGPLEIILHLKNPSKPYILEMIKSGVGNFILKPFDPKVFLNKFIAILQKTSPEIIGQRAHIRIVPDPKDEASVVIRNPKTFKLIAGKIHNISMGGVLFECFGQSSVADISSNQTIKNVQIKFNIQAIEINAASTIVVKGNIVALKFVVIDDYDKNILSKYIYDNLSSEIGAAAPSSTQTPAAEMDQNPVTTPPGER